MKSYEKVFLPHTLIRVITSVTSMTAMSFFGAVIDIRPHHVENSNN